MHGIALLSPEAVTDRTTARVYAEIERELGFGIVPNLFRAMAANPAVLEANWNLFRGTVLQGGLPRVLKEMIGVVVSTVHDSPYARLVHLHSLGLQGVQEDVLRALTSGKIEGQGLSPTATAALRFAQRAARDPSGVTSDDMDGLAQAGLTTQDVLEVIASIQVFTAVNLFTDVVGVEIDQI